MYIYRRQRFIPATAHRSHAMQLTKHTDYAFRVLIYLAGLEGQKTTILTITEAFDISKTHLMKVVNALVNKGWIQSLRGKNGGIKLGVAASEISLRAVVEYMENTLDPINCESPMCRISGACLLKPILVDAQNQYLDYLGNFSIEDLINQNTTQVLKIYP